MVKTKIIKITERLASDIGATTIICFFLYEIIERGYIPGFKIALVIFTVVNMFLAAINLLLTIKKRAATRYFGLKIFSATVILICNIGLLWGLWLLP